MLSSEGWQNISKTMTLLIIDSLPSRAHRSVETLLINLTNDILREMDVGKITAVVLLDLSSAFDTVNHNY